MRDLPTNGAVFDIGGDLLARRGVFEKFLSRPGILGLLGTLPQSRSLLDCQDSQTYASDAGKIGGCTRTRTWGPLIKSQLLYQLSYAPAREGAVYNNLPPACRAARAQPSASP
jgi:hypothetical protein